MNPRNPVSIFVFCLAMFAAAATAFAQGPLRASRARTDVNGGAAVGAAVTLTNDATGIAFTTETRERAAGLTWQVGNYSVRLKQGFKKFIRQHG